MYGPVRGNAVLQTDTQETLILSADCNNNNNKFEKEIKEIKRKKESNNFISAQIWKHKYT